MIHLILPSFYMQKDSADREGKQSQNTVRTPPEPSDCNGLAGPFLIIRTNRKTRCTARVLRFVQIWRDAVRLDLPRTSKARTYSSGSLQGDMRRRLPFLPPTKPSPGGTRSLPVLPSSPRFWNVSCITA